MLLVKSRKTSNPPANRDILDTNLLRKATHIGLAALPLVRPPTQAKESRLQ